MEPEAELALRREAVITAIVAAEDDQPERGGAARGARPDRRARGRRAGRRCSSDLRAAGRLEEVREDLAARQAIDLIAAAAKPIPLAQAQAREELWTPAGEEAAGARRRREPARRRLWTPTDRGHQTS